MKIVPLRVTVRELVNGYQDDGEGGVTGYGGMLDIRPPYQREFVYKDAQRAAVIKTVRNNYPLNVMYWVDRGDGTFEVMDGQQRTISLGQYAVGNFSFDFGKGPKFFYNLTDDEKNQFLDYELFVYVCTGSDSEKLDWFETINLAGEKLSKQELRNAVYHGTWLAAAKTWFSKVNGPADTIADGYVAARTIRQELLQRAIEWIIIRDGQAAVSDYMAEHQNDPNATDLWSYFQLVMEWARSTFPVARKELLGVDWGLLYHLNGSTFPDGQELEQRVKELMIDEDIQRRPGIYAYVFDGDVRHLNIRAFTPAQKRIAYEKQNGLCANGAHCRTPGNGDGKKKFSLAEMEADHITPWSKGGHTEQSNCQLLCLPCNRQKSDL